MNTKPNNPAGSGSVDRPVGPVPYFGTPPKNFQLLQDFALRFLDPEREGYSVGPFVRDAARVALGMECVETDTKTMDRLRSDNERLRDALRKLYTALRNRHYGRMPEEVEEAYNTAADILMPNAQDHRPLAAKENL